MVIVVGRVIMRCSAVAGMFIFGGKAVFLMAHGVVNDLVE